jgi:signal transduction histidine kinase
MIAPAIPLNENERLIALKSYHLLDTSPEIDYEAISKMASEICQTPISLISLIDDKRQWFKSTFGIQVTETLREISFCGHALNFPKEAFIIEDATKDERFYNNPMVIGEAKVVFYAGVPLVNPEGYPLGTLCVLDHAPKKLTVNQIESLKSLARQVSHLMELRKTNLRLEEKKVELEKKNHEILQFSYVLSHDIKTPLNNIISLSEFLKEGEIEDKDVMIGMIYESAHHLKNLTEKILLHYIADNALMNSAQEVRLKPLFKKIEELLNPLGEHLIKIHNSCESSIVTNETALLQIISNLISNGIKYNQSKVVEIEVSVRNEDHQAIFSITDNGIGIDLEHHDAIFDSFKTLGIKDRFHQSGSGIGLATVKNLVEKLGGSIIIDSVIGKGSTFEFKLPAEVEAL